ncbi:hypothetical protein PENTCL1PPCAC_15163, partial [Pristionchus entomophagus]
SGIIVASDGLDGFPLVFPSIAFELQVSMIAGSVTLSTATPAASNNFICSRVPAGAAGRMEQVKAATVHVPVVLSEFDHSNHVAGVTVASTCMAVHFLHAETRIHQTSVKQSRRK